MRVGVIMGVQCVHKAACGQEHGHSQADGEARARAGLRGFVESAYFFLGPLVRRPDFSGLRVVLPNLCLCCAGAAGLRFLPRALVRWCFWVRRGLSCAQVRARSRACAGRAVDLSIWAAPARWRRRGRGYAAFYRSPVKIPSIYSYHAKCCF